MNYDHISIPKSMQQKFPSEEKVVQAIEQKQLVQMGTQTFADDEVAKNWENEALNREEHPFIVVRRDGRNDLFQLK